jgi:hypothetical protein
MNKHCHRILHNARHLIAISIKEVEDVGEVVLCLALGEEEEEDQHVGHG